MSLRHQNLASGIEGYGMVIGRDLERAMAMALTDAAHAEAVGRPQIERFVMDEAARQAAEDHDTLRAVEATRVEMETF